MWFHRKNVWPIIFGEWISSKIRLSRSYYEVRFFNTRYFLPFFFIFNKNSQGSAVIEDPKGVTGDLLTGNGNVPLEIAKEFIDKLISTQSKIEKLSQSILDVLTGNYNLEKKKVLSLPKDIAWIVLLMVYGNGIELKSGERNERDGGNENKINVIISTRGYGVESDPAFNAEIKGYFEKQIKEKSKEWNIKREVDMCWS